jgi:hypothetical protein
MITIRSVRPGMEGFGALLLAVVASGTGAFAEPAPAPAPVPPYTCTLEARFDRLDEAHYIAVRGTTSLPDRALLKVGAFYLKPVSAVFIRPDRPPPPPDLYTLDETEIQLQGGRFEARLWIVRRIPYPGTYRIRAVLHWPDQPAFLRGEKPEARDPLEWSVDIARGAPADMETERAAVRKAVKEDIDRLASIQKDLAACFRKALRDPAAVPAWEAFVKSLPAQFAPIKSRNEDRLEFLVIWSETQGKYRVQDLMERIEELAKTGGEAVRARAAQVPAAVEEQEKAFLAIFDGALNLLGFLKPVDPALVREHLGPIQDDFQRLEKASEALRGGGPGMVPAEVEALKDSVVGRLRAGLGILLQVGPEQSVEPATAYVEAVTAFFADAAAAARGDKAATDALPKRLAAMREPLMKLKGLLTTE